MSERRGAPQKGAAWGPSSGPSRGAARGPGGPRGPHKPNEEKITYIGGMCRGSVAPLPLLTKLLPLVDGGPPVGAPLGPGGPEAVTTIIKKRETLEGSSGGPPATDSVGAASGPSPPYPSGAEDGDSNLPPALWSPGAPEGPPGGPSGGPSGGAHTQGKGGAGDVLMFNPFRKDVGRQGAPRTLEPSGLWVRGELRTVQISVRNYLSVELVLDKAKVIVAGAKAEVYPVTVLVPPSAAHQVTFEVRNETQHLAQRLSYWLSMSCIFQCYRLFLSSCLFVVVACMCRLSFVFVPLPAQLSNFGSIPRLSHSACLSVSCAVSVCPTGCVAFTLSVSRSQGL